MPLDFGDIVVRICDISGVCASLTVIRRPRDGDHYRAEANRRQRAAAVSAVAEAVVVVE